MSNKTVKLGSACLAVDGDLRDIDDVKYLYADGATSILDYGVKLRPGLSARDTMLADMAERGECGLDGALAISNAHARALAVDQLGGWEKILSRPAQSDSEGSLYAVDWLETRILRVVCPSTKHAYYLHVPKEMRTAKEARAWVNRGYDVAGMES